MSLKIAIVGYGIAGIAAAIFLRRSGHDIAHFEQAEKPSVIGSGLLLQKTGLAVLDRLGLLTVALERGSRISRIVGKTHSGKPIMDLDYGWSESGEYGLGLQRGALFDLLGGADEGFSKLNTGNCISNIDTGRGTLIDGDGKTLGPFDLVIAADGAESVIRGTMPSLVRRNHLYPWRALLCLLDDPARNFSDEVTQHFCGGEHVSIWSVGSLRPEEPQRVNLSLRIPAENIASWKERVATLCPKAIPLLEKQSAQETVVVGYRDVELKRLYSGRVVFIGDAAHSMSPQLGQGASMGLLDACMLAKEIEAHKTVEDALVAFDTSRRKHILFYQRLSRLLTPLFQSDSRMLTKIRDGMFYPVSRLHVVERAMLKTLTGRQQGLFGTVPLP